MFAKSVYIPGWWYIIMLRYREKIQMSDFLRSAHNHFVKKTHKSLGASDSTVKSFWVFACSVHMALNGVYSQMPCLIMMFALKIAIVSSCISETSAFFERRLGIACRRRPVELVEDPSALKRAIKMRRMELEVAMIFSHVLRQCEGPHSHTMDKAR